MMSIAYTGPAAEALDQLDEMYSAWSQGVQGLGVDGLARPCGPSEGPFADRSMATLVPHINREVIHHGAEVALLRDLHLWQPAPRRPRRSERVLPLAARRAGGYMVAVCAPMSSPSTGATVVIWQPWVYANCDRMHLTSYVGSREARRSRSPFPGAWQLASSRPPRSDGSVGRTSPTCLPGGPIPAGSAIAT